MRFAPSPTGQLHVGNARTALFNWLVARRWGGVFVLRVEDTDVERSTHASEAAILDDLRWLGLDWDEGPDIGGPVGPYRQSERQELYETAARGLMARGLAYRCFCSSEQLEADRQAALADGRPPKYAGRCRAIDPVEAEVRVTAGEPAAIRFLVPAGRAVTFDDVVRGPVTFQSEVIGDPVLIRSNGFPAYNFAVVIDDAAMEITHVIRGEDHISNTPRQLLLYEALEHQPPVFAHVPLVLGPDHAPLSKRHGATSVAEFRARGYLPEALVNYLALLGWSPGEGEEIVGARELTRRFDVSAVSHSAAVFDIAKLAWMNRHYMKEASPARLAGLALPDFVAAGLLRETRTAREYVQSILPIAVGSVDRLEEIPDRVEAVFRWDAETAAALVAAEPAADRVLHAMAAFATHAEACGLLLDRDAFRGLAGRVRQETGLKGRELFHPMRVMLTGAESGPELDLIVPAIDRAASLPAGDTRVPVVPCHARARAVVDRLRAVVAGREDHR
ncbi:MAG: glutamate--tRNA ligase [Acidobacteria bacterium]|nr:glutamate--tRNA ligase [Acidobacteriota bacterium]